MTIDEFWQIIGKTRVESGWDGDQFEAILTTRLSTLTSSEVQSFDLWFDRLHALAYRWDLWAAAYLLCGGASDDGFHYFRTWLIAQGREIYEAAMHEPDNLADFLTEADIQRDDFDWEAVAYVAREVWEEKTAAEDFRLIPDDAPEPPAVPIEESRASREPAGEEWTEDDLPILLPRLNSLVDAAYAAWNTDIK